jgi:hypothetical protein
MAWPYRDGLDDVQSVWVVMAKSLPAAKIQIGWWLYGGLPTSLALNAQRTWPMPVPVIQEMAAALADLHFGPSRAEGCAAICAVMPSHHKDLMPLLRAELAARDRRIRAASNRQRKLQRHGLLAPARSGAPAPPDPPAEQLDDRAAGLLGWLHGACYANAAAIRADRAWLVTNGFCSPAQV